ncbi:glucuronate isomerase [Salipaludibacillus agaradhaerens]|uniref:glucuronate isomerase n=1 Tax=Salipaludibacillus agaradhaerens TaxID=76935 RepID=UPI00215197D2|nr:glucuronate isomerase [Salipaludibacillus agaradhaerens]MCR6104885.1 glucuronate isomerase [Salipaludibacillus agaradhaerens]MCR6116932.1 glucuronate isomerase [Salipaludibacillus agaradhaerens]
MITEDFLLTNPVSVELYHHYAKAMPIIDFHNHLSAADIYYDRQYDSISELWLEGDHYKWRAMRANGIDERVITGDTSSKEKFDAWAQTVPNTLGNPLYHWTHLELKRFFAYDGLLSEKTGDEVFALTNKALKHEGLTARKMLEMQQVEFVGTTDDPVDSLKYHRKLKEEGYSVVVAPSFRPDKGLLIEADSFTDWLKALEEAAHIVIKDYSALLLALEKRMDVFEEAGCRASDHGINEMYYEETTTEEVTAIFNKRLNGEELSPSEVRKYKTHTLTQLAKSYYKKKWVMQLHIGPLRNNYSAMYDKVGADAGFDSIGDAPVANPLNQMLDTFASKGFLPKTILYTLNPRDNILLATTAGNFQDSDVPGKVQFGTAWWFNDHYDGMVDQMKTLASVGLLKHFVGMLTDSRSMLSFTRHEYFRRILCQLLGQWVEEGKIPYDMELLGDYVESICYGNAKRYFGL